MTTGTKTSDHRTMATDGYGTTGLIGSYLYRAWNGQDNPRATVTTQNPFVIERVLVREARPARVVTVERYRKVPFKGPNGKILYRRQLVRVSFMTKPKPAKYRTRRWYTAVANPKLPRRPPPDHPYTLTVSRRVTSLCNRIQTDKIAEMAYDPVTQGFTKFAGWKYVTTSKVAFTNASPQPFEPLTWSANDQLELIGKLREKFAGSDFNFGVFLAESNEALGTIFSAATRLSNALKQLRKGNFAGAAHALLPSGGAAVRRASGLSRKVKPLSRELSGQWLELQYGWLPLLKDMEGAAQFIAHLQSAPIQQSYRVGRKKLANRMSSPVWRSTGVKIETSQIIARVKTVDIIGLGGLKDPFSVAWEKLPFSFVADWVIPIGQFLSARALACSIEATYVSTRTTKTTDLGATYESPADTYPRVVYTKGEYRVEDFSMNRTVSSSLGVPLPRVKSLEQAASWKRATNAVALVVQVFTGRR